MADQDRCPECGHKSEPEKLRDQSGDTSGVDPSPDLPDEVLRSSIDEAEEAIYQVANEADVLGTVGPMVRHMMARAAVACAAPVLIEHGRQQERAAIEDEMSAAVDSGAADEQARIRGNLTRRLTDMGFGERQIRTVLAALVKDGAER